ncbi:putative carnitinyl- dehydratase protein [Phaeoacremonium minimum UCRPA7]|uniref:Putative carnitinyl-dehydratase protein n=1 Tax=Phaeoacremonium minimum (strain UCR-PA7) TaxID=1286976 RepID=R8BBN9_PHAM7|nr:putative carnitinyl- dehydratase protein [Phaeoacremonium minimum UCRPA7]EON96716.1 putative carnitinyl- dehydratase protein [Phaeoacremonium minimum UCRPA7]
MSNPFIIPPPDVPNAIISFPSPHVLLVTLNRPKQLNAIPSSLHSRFDALWRWYDSEPSLRCAVLTGSGRAFCAGADLKEWNERHNASSPQQQDQERAAKSERWMASGFGGLSNRAGKKPIIAAVNGLCLGGGMEIAINCDLIIASAEAKFGLPEVTRGVIALAGALPRLIRTAGRQRASEMALVGRMYTAAEMREWGLVNIVVEKGQDEFLQEAIKLADAVAANSPDAVIASKEGLRLGWEPIGPELGTDIIERGIYGRMDAGENMKEGVRSFVERRKPVWKDSKL